MMDEMTIVFADKLNMKCDRKPIPPKNIIQAHNDKAKLLKRYLALYFELNGIVTDVTATINTVPRMISK